jgi:hypothetical protein
VVVVLLIIAFFVWRRQRKKALAKAHQQLVIVSESGSAVKPILSLAPEYKFHIFLSHVWATGQDQIANLQRQILDLLPGARVFRDLDDLEDTSKLEEHIGDSQLVLLFLSKGCDGSGSDLSLNSAKWSS